MSEEGHGTGRVEAFSDGVFAIAITLLILEIGVPHVEANQSLTHELLRLWPSYLSYVISFLVIGIMWSNHHSIFREIQRTDQTLLALNLLLLLLIAFVPFPTALLAEYLHRGEHLTEAAVVFGATFTAIALAFNALWWYASTKHGIMHADVTPAAIRSRTRRYWAGPIVYGATIPLAFLNPWISIAIFAALALFFLIPVTE